MGVGMMRGRRVRVAGVGLALTLAGVGWGQVTQIVEPPAPLLPTNARMVADAGDAPAETAAEAAALKEDGLIREETRGVAGHGGWVRAYQFGDATGALAAFTTLGAGGRAVGAAKNGVETVREMPGGGRVVLDGVSVVRVQAKAGMDALLKEIATGLPKVSGRRALAPLLPTLLPQEGLERGSLRYALGPASYMAMGGQLPGVNDLGWDKSLEVATATYDLHGKTGTLTLLMYPTPQIAGDRGRALAAAINAEGEAKLGTVKMHRVGPMVGVTTGDWTPAGADAEVHGLKLNQELSFDKKMPLEFHAEVTKTFSLLQNIAVLSGVLGLAAVLLGLFLGGARAGIRVLRGKPAASEPEFLTINLRGGPGTGLGGGGEKGA